MNEFILSLQIEYAQYPALFYGIALLVLLVAVVFFVKRKAKKISPVEAQKTTTAAAPTETPAVPATARTAITDDERVTKGLGRTKAFFQQTLDRLFSGSEGAHFFEDMEEALLTADVGIEFAERVVTDLKKNLGVKIPARSELKSNLAQILFSQLPQTEAQTETATFASDARPHVIMVVGVNGAGKTTTIAKLCSRFQSQNKKVLVGAADTFRAAATEQLKTWIERVGADGVFQKEGSDPSAVAFDSVQAAQGRGSDICIIDTAGRLHTKVNLMEELKKMKRVIGKAMPGAPHDVWLVIDGTTGQNALNQAREFHQHLELTGVIITKLDGSSKGGIVLAIAAELKVPVVFIGVGETPEDLVPFNGQRFVETLLAGL